MNFFHLDNSYGFYLEMVMFPQEIVMAIWLVVKGFNPSALAFLSAKIVTTELMSAAQFDREEEDLQPALSPVK